MPPPASPSDAAQIRVAVVIPILNEALTLGATLDSVIGQDYPRDLYEILIIDGGSSDDWKSIVDARASSDRSIRCLANPKQTTAAAVNLALRSSDAEAILWISGHCLLSPNYIAAAVGAFVEDRSSVSGGMFEVTGHGTAGRLNACVLNSRFGTGLASWRFGRDYGRTQTVTFALFSRRRLLEIGGLNERLLRHQDNDLVDRLQRGGAHFRRVDAHATYIAPANLGGLLRRAWSNGSWNLWCLRLGIGGFSWWHMTPMAAVGIGLALLIASMWSPAAGIVLLGLAATYALMAVGFSVAAARKSLIWAIPVLPVLFFVHHVVYGLGSWHAVAMPIPQPVEGRESSVG